MKVRSLLTETCFSLSLSLPHNYSATATEEKRKGVRERKSAGKK
jgi:hypothetical protein